MKIYFTLTLLLFSCSGFSQSKAWGGKKAAVVITYDDAIDQHLDHALPLLDSLGLKATFYVTAFSTSMQNRMAEWKKLPTNGHELGNHTLYHPCMGGDGRSWVPTDYDLRNYTVRRMQDEMRMTNLFLEALDGKKERTFAFTCGDRIVSDSSFIKSMKSDFIAARSVRHEMHNIAEIDLYDVDCYVVANHTATQMIEWVDKAIENKSMFVILFHGVGGGNGLDVTLDDHRKFLLYLKSREKDLMIAPMLETAKHIRQWQDGLK